MGWFTKRGDDMPALAEVGQTLAPQYAATVQVRGPESVHVTGSVRGRGLLVDIESRKRRLEGLHRIGTGPRAQRAYRMWTSELAVSCVNPHGLQGSVTSFQDVHDPAWEPRGFDPSQCRKVVTDPPALAARVLTPSSHSKLLRPWDDITIHIDATAVRLHTEQQASLELGYFGGCPFHRHPDGGTLPDRFLVGPPWWVDLLCEIADAVDLLGQLFPELPDRRSRRRLGAAARAWLHAPRWFGAYVK